MQEQIKGAAWALGLWGVLSIILGLLILAWPGITLKVFLVILGVYFVVSGLTMLVGSLLHHSGHWIGGALIGGISTLAGLYVFDHPGISALAVLTVIAIWAIVAGTLQLVAGFEGPGTNWWLVIGGLVNALFGLYIFANPKGGAIATIWLIGLAVIVTGVMSAVAAFKLGAFSRHIDQQPRIRA